MKISPDETLFFEYGFVKINLTIVTTWVLIIVISLAAKLITRNISSANRITHWQSVLEMLLIRMREQLKEIGLKNTEKYIGFIGSLFIFIAIANFCIIFPGYVPPTSSLSTTAALSISVFLAVPIFGVEKKGVWKYLKTYFQPSVIMLPFNIIAEISRTFALAIRLFGNIMSGGLIISIMLSLTPILFPILLTVLGLITGLIQAYIFSILATVYIAAATQEPLK